MTTGLTVSKEKKTLSEQSDSLNYFGVGELDNPRKDYIVEVRTCYSIYFLPSEQSSSGRVLMSQVTLSEPTEMTDMSHVALIASTVSGFMLHRIHFIYGEHHLQAPIIVSGYVSALLSITFYFAFIHKDVTFFSGTLLVINHVIGLLASMSIYRLFFHSLRGFPGPFDMRLSKLAHVVRLVQNRCKNYEILEVLQQDYGDFVRTGT